MQFCLDLYEGSNVELLRGTERASLLSARLGTGPNIRRKISRSCDVAIVFDGGRGICVHGSLCM